MNQIPPHDPENSSKPRNFFLRIRHRWVWGFFLATALALVVVLLNLPFLPRLRALYELLINREQISDYVKSFGSAAPLVFMALQIIQVILAPIPGEATGIIGGYLFGIAGGTLYSTVALTLGSYINFVIGRLLGKKWVRKMIPPVKLAKMDYLLRHQALYVVFILFLFPGFPKDYLCLFLGISNMPVRVFLLMALIGRFPGTFLLNIQGSLVFERNYFVLFLMVIFCGTIFVLGYYYRNRLYQWIDKIGGSARDKIDGQGK